jgi:hypothetical protein
MPTVPPFSPSEKSDSGSFGDVTVTSPGTVDTISSINLPGTSNEAYPATELIKYLIDAVGRDAMSLRRNAQMSYLLVDRTRDIFDAINTHIRRVESGEDWESYDKFTSAIDPIEE